MNEEKKKWQWGPEIEVLDPRMKLFSDWWNNGGDKALGELDIVDKDRAIAGYLAGIEWFQKEIKPTLETFINEEEKKKPFIDRRGISDSVNRQKFREGFLRGIKDSIKDNHY